MKPFVRPAKWSATRWFRKRLLPRLKRKEHLGWASVWILCSSCSFNNSFQDGCLGQIRIEVPPTKKAQGKRKKKAPGAKVSPSKRASPKTLQASLSPKRARPKERGIQLITLNWKALTAQLRKVRPKKPKAGLMAQASDALLSPARHSLQKMKRALPGVLEALFLRGEHELLRLALPSRPGVFVLHNTEDAGTWSERPQEIQMCFHMEGPNQGWTQYHQARSSAKIAIHCQKGYPLGSGRHWFAINDTFAATAMPCRAFFSPGRTHIVAQCGSTIYRTPIRNYARCLLTGKGKRCSFPHATMAKQPPDAEQLIELRK